MNLIDVFFFVNEDVHIYIYICFLGYSIEDTQLEVMDKQTKWGCNGYNNNCSDNIVYYIYIYTYIYTYIHIYTY